MSTLLEKLTAYGASDYYGFHMPGHKRKLDMLEGVTPCQIDITEIDGFDDLHHAEGILREAQERAAETYHADETHFLVNGSTVGILSAILGVTMRSWWQGTATNRCIMLWKCRGFIRCMFIRALIRTHS